MSKGVNLIRLSVILLSILEITTIRVCTGISVCEISHEYKENSHM
jgi:hypothetical protein